MNFEITNSIYAALVGIFAAVMGIAYPLMLQSIEKIDTRYGSTRLAKCLEEDNRFKRFNSSLRWSIFFAFVSGFALYFFDDSRCVKIVIMVVYSIVTLWLVINTIALYGLFMNFFYPKDFLKYLKMDKEPRLFEILDLTCYAADRENVELYNKGITYIGDYIVKKNLAHGTASYERKVIEEILKRTSRNDAPRFLRIDTSGIFLYFSCMPLDYRMMWKTLRQHIDYENYDWLLNYWEIADQHYRTIVNNEYYMDKEDAEYPSHFAENDITEFKEFHIALCALVLHHRKIDWLHQMVHFTNVAPARYDLSLCTFRGIFRWLRHFNSLLHQADPQKTLEYKYPFILHSGVNAENVTYHHIVGYLAYSMLHLNDFNYNVRLVEPSELPSPCYTDNKEGKIIPINKRFINLAETLKEYVIDINKVIGHPSDVEQQVIYIIENFIDKCKSVICDTINTKKWSDEKEKHIRERLAAEFKKQAHNLILPIDSNLTDAEEQECFSQCEAKISFSDIFEGDYSYSINLETVLVSCLIKNIQLNYNQLFLLNSTEAKFWIQYADVDKVLRRLELSNHHVIIGMGIDLEGRYASKISATVKDVIAHRSEIIILKKSSLPYVLFCNSDTNIAGLEPISGNDGYLYSNMEELKNSNSTENLNRLFLRVSVKYKLCKPASKLYYIRIKIIQDDRINICDIDKITNADSYLR